MILSTSLKSLCQKFGSVEIWTRGCWLVSAKLWNKIFFQARTVPFASSKNVKKHFLEQNFKTSFRIYFCRRGVRTEVEKRGLIFLSKRNFLFPWISLFEFFNFSKRLSFYFRWEPFLHFLSPFQRVFNHFFASKRGKKAAAAMVNNVLNFVAVKAEVKRSWNWFNG